MGLVDDHERACDGFAHVADQVVDERWDAPTPCTEWDARALVEHVIGFHELLLLRPLGVRADRPKGGSPPARWRATQGALTADVLVHSWDLGVSTGVPFDLDPELLVRYGRDPEWRPPA